MDLNEGKRRIEAGEAQTVRIAAVSDATKSGEGRSYVLVPDAARGTDSLRVFRPGQYVDVQLVMERETIYRSFSICSGPGDVHRGGGSYMLTIGRVSGGVGSNFILDTWEVGTELLISHPLGEYYGEDLPAGAQLLCLGGGSGITPFFSMASAVADGLADHRMTILLGFRDAANIYLEEELADLVAHTGGRVKGTLFLEKRDRQPGEPPPIPSAIPRGQGLLTAEHIRPHLPEGEFFTYISGSEDFRLFAREQLGALGITDARVRDGA